MTPTIAVLLSLIVVWVVLMHLFFEWRAGTNVAMIHLFARTLSKNKVWAGWRIGHFLRDTNAQLYNHGLPYRVVLSKDLTKIVVKELK